MTIMGVEDPFAPAPSVLCSRPQCAHGRYDRGYAAGEPVPGLAGVETEGAGHLAAAGRMRRPPPRVLIPGGDMFSDAPAPESSPEPVLATARDDDDESSSEAVARLVEADVLQTRRVSARLVPAEVGEALRDADAELYMACGSCVEISVPPLPTIQQLSRQLVDRMARPPPPPVPTIGQLSEPWATSDELHTIGGTDETSGQAVAHDAPRTTVALQRLPLAISAERVCYVLDQLGFQCMYDVVSVTRRRVRRVTLGRAFVNFLGAADAEACIRLVHGHPFNGHEEEQEQLPQQRTCTATYAKCQGAAFVAKCFSAHVQRRRGAE